jgi:hypothetical protein
MQLTTVRQAINSNLPTIGNLSESDPIVIKSTIAMEFENLLDFLNIGKVMNDSQIAQTIEMILACYPDLNLADIKLFFMWLKKGQYGKFYDRIDGSIILEALEAYNLAKIEEIENIHNERKYQSQGSFHPKVIEVMNAAVNDHRKRKLEEKKSEPPRILSEAEKFYQRSLKQFDNLFRGSKFRKFKLEAGLRALKLGETIFTIDTFVERKINNKINSQQY